MSGGRYAENTAVSSEQSRADIERTLERYGASSFAYASRGTQAIVAFEMEGRQVRFVLTLPPRDDRRFTQTPAGRARRSEDEIRKAWEQSVRQSWRALLLVVKAKLEAVAAGIAVFEDEFLAYVVLPDGSTVGEHARPAVAEAYTTGQMPQLVPDYRPAITAGGSS